MYTYDSTLGINMYRMPVSIIQDSSQTSDYYIGTSYPMVDICQIGNLPLEQQLREVEVQTGTSFTYRDYGASTTVYQEVWKIPHMNRLRSRVNGIMSSLYGNVTTGRASYPFGFYCSSSTGMPTIYKREYRNITVNDSINLVTFEPAPSNGWGNSADWRILASNTQDATTPWAFKIDLKTWYGILKRFFSSDYRVYITMDMVFFILKRFDDEDLEVGSGMQIMCTEYKLLSQSGSTTNSVLGKKEGTVYNLGFGEMLPLNDNNYSRTFFHTHNLLYTNSLGASVPANAWEFYFTPIMPTFMSEFTQYIQNAAFGPVRPSVRLSVCVVYDG